MPPPDALVRTTERGTKVKGASELTPSRLRTLVSRTALSTHFPLPWPFFSTTNSRRGESHPPPPPVFKTSLQFRRVRLSKDIKVGGGIPRQKKKNGRAGRHEISIVEIPFCRGQGSPFPGSLVCAGFFASGAEWFLVKRSDARPLRIFPAAEMFGIFGATPPPPRPKPRSGPTKSPRAEETEPRAGGR